MILLNLGATYKLVNFSCAPYLHVPLISKRIMFARFKGRAKYFASFLELKCKPTPIRIRIPCGCTQSRREGRQEGPFWPQGLRGFIIEIFNFFTAGNVLKCILSQSTGLDRKNCLLTSLAGGLYSLFCAGPRKPLGGPGCTARFSFQPRIFEKSRRCLAMALHCGKVKPTCRLDCA